MSRPKLTLSRFTLMEAGLLGLSLVLPVGLLLLAPTSATGQEGSFNSMAIARDEADECRAPKPPADLAETAYLRNGYRAILRSMAAEKWQETQSCECYLTQITWEEVVVRSGDFKVSDDTRRPFDVSELRLLADAMLAERDEACAQ